MKKIIFMATMLLMVSGVLMAQGPNRNMDPKERAEQMTKTMVKDYSLNETQKAKVHELNLDMSDKMSKISGNDREARRTEMQKIRENYNTKLKDVLTKEQFEAYTKAEKERRDRRGR